MARERHGLHACALMCAVLQLMLITRGHAQRAATVTPPDSETIAVDCD